VEQDGQDDGDGNGQRQWNRMDRITADGQDDGDGNGQRQWNRMDRITADGQDDGNDSVTGWTG